VTNLSDTERRAWLRLARTQNVGPVTFAQLVGRFGSASTALKEVPRMVKRGGGDELRIPSDDDAARELAALAKIGGRMIASCEADFPRGLAAVEPPPPLLSVVGHATLLQREMVAVIGARNASALTQIREYDGARPVGCRFGRRLRPRARHRRSGP